MNVGAHRAIEQPRQPYPIAWLPKTFGTCLAFVGSGGER